MAGPDALERFTRAAAARGVTVEPVRYPQGTRTAADAAAAIGCDVAQIVKSLVFATDDGAVLALTSGANRVDLGRLAEVIGRAVCQADADLARGATGFAIGGTPPFGHPTAVPTWCDADLLEHDVVYGAAGTPDTCFPITPDELLRASGATVADFAER